MYYHCRPLKYVEYGKVFPPSEETCNFLLPAYKWLGNYCGYCPQVWLARSNLSVTGYKNQNILKKRQHVIQKRNSAKEHNESVLFGFDIIKGFPVSFRYWELIIMLMNGEKILSLRDQNKHIVSEMNEIFKPSTEEDEDQEFIAWKSCNGDFDLFLKKYLFVEVDQVVVPCLNLKAAKEIICRDEHQKKALRRMGFIEDRIKIKNFKRHTW